MPSMPCISNRLLMNIYKMNVTYSADRILLKSKIYFKILPVLPFVKDEFLRSHFNTGDCSYVLAQAPGQ